MAAVAAEMSQSETAFVQPRDDGDGDWELRWFGGTSVTVARGALLL
jgi:predicted PhzF superfamily epimerase YddE/YHI9